MSDDCLNTKKRSVDAVLRQKRQGGAADNIPDVMIDPGIVSQIMNTNLPNLMNASLTSGEWIKCCASGHLTIMITALPGAEILVERPCSLSF